MTDNSYANQCIECTVKSCKNHHENRDYCSLESIMVNTNEPHPQKPQCTNCLSFEPID